jgi:PAS domain S-box-containing protein
MSAGAANAAVLGSQQGFDELRRATVVLLALSALPDSWATLDREAIADTTADVLQTMPDVRAVHIHLPSAHDGPAIDVRRGRAIAGEASMTPDTKSAPIGPDGGFIAVSGPTEPRLSDPVNRLLLRTAANQISTALGRRGADETAKRLALLVERSNDFIGVASLDGSPGYINQSGLALVGLSRLDGVGSLHIVDFLLPTERARFATEAIPAMTGRGRWIGEAALRHFVTGEAIPVRIDCFRVDDVSTGRPASFATVMHDIRPQKEVERDLREAAADATQSARQRTIERDDAKARLEEVRLELYHAARLGVAGQMAAMLAHELSQPLTAALIAANAARRLCLADSPPIDEVRELVEDCAAQAERTGMILHRLRQFVRPAAAADHQPEPLRRLVEDAIGFAFVGPDAVGVTLDLHFDPEAPAVRVDRIQIQQVIANLVRNALDALRGVPAGTIRLSTVRRDADSVEILVADNGPGLDDAVQAQIFEPFFSSKPNGMGLGLSICRTIVEGHGGTIRHETRSQGGALFHFTLPAADAGVAG